ncbi:unnamed protein product [Allacma fusca]|uniref:C-type lectin domain-containing protein n=1 Tax=Allacma fusca TaxID=39272 RepID=A0A8J2KZJ5_9HEXA|nr:unnamed protein product [Allacma fusca]
MTVYTFLRFILIVVTATSICSSPAYGSTVPLSSLTRASFVADSTSSYFISTGKATFQEAQEICVKAGYELASIETAGENEELVERLRRAGVDEAWTSGKQVMDQYSSHFIWDSNGRSVFFEDFVPEIEDTPHFPNQTYLQVDTEVKEYTETSCMEGGDLNPIPCNVSEPQCYIKDQQKCTVEPGECSLEKEPCCSIEKQAYCTTTPGKCNTTTPDCTITQGKCTVPPPNCNKTCEEKCNITTPPCQAFQPPCKIIPGVCMTIFPATCPPTVCVSTVPPCVSHTSKACLILMGEKANCTSTVCPPPSTSCKRSGPCRESKEICGSPTVFCPAPIVHCPEPCVTCVAPNITCETPTPSCEAPTVKCEPPVVVCSEPETKCEPPVIKCEDPRIICKEPCVKCYTPEICCDDPVVTCPPCRPKKPCDPVTPVTPATTQPPCKPCTTSVALRKPCEKGDCDPCCTTLNGSKGLRHIRSVGHECIAISRDSGYKWVLKDCQMERHFICEAKE